MTAQLDLLRTSVLRFTVPGTAVPYQRAGVFTGPDGVMRRFTPDKHRKYAREVTKIAKHALAELRHAGGAWDPKAQVRLEIVIVPPDRRQRDLSNICKTIEDALNPPRRKKGSARPPPDPSTLIWFDDAQVAELYVARVDPDRERPRVEVKIQSLAQPDSNLEPIERVEVPR